MNITRKAELSLLEEPFPLGPQLPPWSVLLEDPRPGGAEAPLMALAGACPETPVLVHRQTEPAPGGVSRRALACARRRCLPGELLLPPFASAASLSG